MKNIKFKILHFRKYWTLINILTLKEIYECGIFSERGDIGTDYLCDDFENYTFMQAIGLLDKNGVEVYEGDIVKWKQANGGIIVSDNNAYICLIERDRIGRSCIKNKEHVGFTLASEHIEVIGNIFQNPDLLN